MLFSKTADVAKSVQAPMSDVDKRVGQNSAKSSRPDFDSMGLGHREIIKEADNEVKVGNFLRLFIEQIKNQNPLDPQDNADFLGQLAQFSSVEGLAKIDKTVEGLVESIVDTRALQVSGLIGRNVDVKTNRIMLTDDNEISGSVKVDSPAEDMKITFSDSAGQVVKSFDVGEQMPGDFKFRWDGKDANGNRLPPGGYRVAIEARIDGVTEKLKPILATPVESVAIDRDSGTYTLNLATSDKIDLSEVEEIK